MTHVSESVACGPSVLIPRKGSLGNIYFVEGEFWNVDTIFYTEIDARVILPRYVYHLLLNLHLDELNQAGGVPSLTQSTLNALRIPVPPLPVQQEIVRILDSFVKLEAELEAELEARRIQYKHVARSLLTAPPGRAVSEDSACRLGDLGEWFGGGTPNKSRRDYWKNGSIPWISPKDMRSSIVEDAQDYITTEAVEASATKLLPANCVAVVARSSILDHTLPVARLPRRVALNQDMKALHPSEGVSASYVAHALVSFADDILRAARKRGGSVASLDTKSLMNFRIPLPPLEQQSVVASALDSLDALINDLVSGLPAEIQARRQQYEYYRDKLLTFEEWPA
jgi:type I restriction enzyme S subunit